MYGIPVGLLKQRSSSLAREAREGETLPACLGLPGVMSLFAPVFSDAFVQAPGSYMVGIA